MLKRPLIVSIALAIVLGAGGFFAWSRYTGSPEYALKQIGASIEERNRLRFQTYVDLDRLLPALVDQLVGQAMLESLGSDEADGFQALGAALVSAFGEQIKPALTQALRSAILRAVDQGSLDSLYAATDTANGIDLTEIGTGTGVRAERFRGLAAIQREGDVALAGFRFFHPHLDTTLVLQVRMERVGDRWMVVAPENLGSYLQEVQKLRREHLDRLNAEVSDRVARILELGPYERERERFGRLTVARITQRVTNRSERPVHLAFGWLEPPGDSEADREILLADRDDLGPGDSTTLTAALYGTADSPVPSVYWSGDLEGFATSLSLVVGEGDSAEYVGPYGDWEEYLARLEDPNRIAQSVLEASASADASDPLADMLGRADADPWIVSEDTNPLDDSPIVVLANEAQSGRNSYGRQPTLVLRCRNNTTEVYISWDEYLGSDSPLVTYRVGDGESWRSRWSLSTSNTAAFYPGSHIALIREMMQSDRFVAQVTPYGESPITAVFDLSGLEQRITPLREACHW